MPFFNLLVTPVLLKAYVLDVTYEKYFESDVIERLHQAIFEHGVLWPHSQALSWVELL